MSPKTLDFAIQIGGLNIWDIVAPKLIIEEAGGICDIKKFEEKKYSVTAGDSATLNILGRVVGI